MHDCFQRKRTKKHLIWYPNQNDCAFSGKSPFYVRIYLPFHENAPFKNIIFSHCVIEMIEKTFDSFINLKRIYLLKDNISMTSLVSRPVHSNEIFSFSLWKVTFRVISWVMIFGSSKKCISCHNILGWSLQSDKPQK